MAESAPSEGMAPRSLAEINSRQSSLIQRMLTRPEKMSGAWSKSAEPGWRVNKRVRAAASLRQRADPNSMRSLSLGGLTVEGCWTEVMGARR